MDMKQVGLALSGFGAGVQGNLPQFHAGLAAQEKAETEQGLLRRKAMITDNRITYDFLMKGDTDSALKHMENRYENVVALGGDPSTTAERIQLLRNGEIDTVLKDAKDTDRAAVLAGEIDAFPVTGAESPTGKLIADRERIAKKYGEGSRQVQFIDQKLAEDEGSGGIGTVSPKDFTVESLAAYEQSGKIGDLVRYTPKVIDVGGVKIREGADGVWAPVVTAEDLSGEASAVAEIEADRQTRLDFATAKSKWFDIEPQVLSSISEAEQKQTVINNTVAEIKKRINGWTTKYGASLSGLPGSQARVLSGLLDTIKANSAFTTLKDLKAGGGTLGAISGAELQLLERAWGALDQGGDSGELLRVLEQITGQNAGSLVRMRNGYDMNSQRFAGSYDDSKIARVKSSAPPPNTNAKGWPLHTDAQGNQAYVGPNGEIQEVQ